MLACIHRLVSGILEFDAHIHMMARDTHMRAPDIHRSHGDNFLLVSSLSPQFELKMHKVTFKYGLKSATNEEGFKDANSNTRGHGGHHRHSGGGGDGGG